MAYDQIKELTGLKEQFDFLYDVPHHPLAQAVMDLHKAFANFFEGRARFPTFRERGQNDSFRYPDPKRIKIEEDRMFLPKAGWTRMVMHRPIVGKVKNVTISSVAGEWFASVQTEHEARILVNRGPAVGTTSEALRRSSSPMALSSICRASLPPTAAGLRQHSGCWRGGRGARAIAKRRNRE